MRILSFLLLVTAAAAAAAPSAADPQAVLRAIEDNRRGIAARATLTMTVERPDRRTEYVMAIWTDGEDRGLVHVRAPARDAGQAFLRDGDNLWIYNPRLRRTLRLPPSGRSESFLGSDISYSDLSGRDAEHDYTPRVTGDDGTTIVLELLPKPGAPTPYGKVVVRAQSRTYVPLEWLLYDQRDQAVKRITFSAHMRVEQRQFPTRTVVEDLLRAGHRTTVVYTEPRFGPVPDACFTQRALEDGC